MADLTTVADLVHYVANRPSIWEPRPSPTPSQGPTSRPSETCGWCPRPLAGPRNGADCRSPLAGALRFSCELALVRGRPRNERLDEPQLRTGCNRDLSEPRWWQPGGRRAARAVVDCQSTSLAARPMATRSSRPPRIRRRSRHACTPDGVITMVDRRSSAWRSVRAGTLHPAITSYQVSPKRGEAPFEPPWTTPGPGGLRRYDQVSAQPSPRTGRNCGTSSRIA